MVESRATVPSFDVLSNNFRISCPDYNLAEIGKQKSAQANTGGFQAG
jgi:hypothetical protein